MSSVVSVSWLLTWHNVLTLLHQTPQSVGLLCCDCFYWDCQQGPVWPSLYSRLAVHHHHHQIGKPGFYILPLDFYVWHGSIIKLPSILLRLNIKKIHPKIYVHVPKKENYFIPINLIIYRMSTKYCAKWNTCSLLWLLLHILHIMTDKTYHVKMKFIVF